MPRHNNVIANAHFHKDWQHLVRTWFDQPGQKKSRRQARTAKAVKVAPRPVDTLRPIVHAQTFRYHTKIRGGRGFTLEELKEAKINPKFAQTIGICVDHRRVNRSLESLQANVQRLKEYKSKLVLFPRKTKAPKKADSPAELTSKATQVALSAAVPVRQGPAHFKARAITAEDTKRSVYNILRVARADARMRGIREKKKREAAEEAKDKKPAKE
ncbi:ribosomal protein L13 [Capsaspora owczarzaki ATCC 30864]|uniref:Ribosomal protein L13 n=1 Tax=Capsaspora owczarzaki (strain ATCC 30864) TaxID=595528 RepID=A0A0D2WPD9_CAPO3|nr:ribosomal protein L13 [Capsaspora owczarzaki ATCC 30864]KJE93210.1 ribosomal protein L13 [Capsaspora owczarzaki ATCC 30864]|eukprot:XP_004347856.1 ribosomal protein L13 [Capsaspora owczarzaki ATCC 30864]